MLAVTGATGEVGGRVAARLSQSRTGAAFDRARPIPGAASAGG